MRLNMHHQGVGLRETLITLVALKQEEVVKSTHKTSLNSYLIWSFSTVNPKMSIETSDMSEFSLTNAALIRRADGVRPNVFR